MTAQCEWIGCYTDLDDDQGYYCDTHASAEDRAYDRVKDARLEAEGLL